MTTATASAKGPAGLDWSRYFRPGGSDGGIRIHASIGRCPAWLALGPHEKLLVWAVLAQASHEVALRGAASVYVTLQSLQDLHRLLGEARLRRCLEDLADRGYYALQASTPDGFLIDIPYWRSFERVVPQ